MTAAGDRRVVVITGAASGMGLASVRAMAEAGAATVGVDLAGRPSSLSELPDVAWVQGDVASAATWESVSAAVLGLDDRGARGLIACAADVVVLPFLETPIDEWRRLFEVNVLGVIRAMQTLLPAMLQRGSGAIAVVCSVNSLFVEDQVSAYSSSKAALLHVVRSAALEYADRGVRINAVCPGAVETPLLQRHLSSLDDPEGARRDIERRTPTGRILDPDEIARVLRFLLSEEATGLSGSAVVVDGGLTTTYDFDRLRR